MASGRLRRSRVLGTFSYYYPPEPIGLSRKNDVTPHHDGSSLPDPLI